MNRTKIFLAAPISGFSSKTQYTFYRENVCMLIDALTDKYEVYSEIDEISSVKSYDTPIDSLEKDFKAIKDADIFVLLHPMRMQTSSLIELGYACALKKKLLIVGEKEDLPYLALGLKKPNYNALTIYSSEISSKMIKDIINALDSLNNK